MLREPRMASRCADPEGFLLIERGRLVGIARERIADAILEAQA